MEIFTPIQYRTIVSVTGQWMTREKDTQVTTHYLFHKEKAKMMNKLVNRYDTPSNHEALAETVGILVPNILILSLSHYMAK